MCITRLCYTSKWESQRDARFPHVKLCVRVLEAVNIICDSLHLKTTVMWHVLLSSTRQCLPVFLSWLAIISLQSLPISLFLYLKKSTTNLKAFLSYHSLTAVVLKEVKQMLFLILHFQRILAKPCCSLGPPTGEPGIDSHLLGPWEHPVANLNSGWDGMQCPYSSPNPDTQSAWAWSGLGLAPTDPWLPHRVHPSFKLDTISVSWPTSHLPSTTYAADTEVSCLAMPLLFPSIKATSPLKIICLMPTLPQIYANPLWQYIYKNLLTFIASLCHSV